MLILVGMGPGHSKYLTQDAIEAIQWADLVIAFGRIAETAESIVSSVIRVKSIKEVLEYVPSSGNVALLASGDPGFYGILDYLKKQKIVIDRVVPGLSSFQYLMARLQKSWQHAHFVSLHGREDGLEQIVNHPLSILLTDRQHAPHIISRRLREMDLAGTLYIGYNLSYENERILEVRIGDPLEECEDISVMVVEYDMDS